jgi:hypothetical protein
MMRECICVYRRIPTSIYKGMALGGVGVLAGVYIHAVTANSFIIVRIQEPLWFLIAMIVSLPGIVGQNTEKIKTNALNLSLT